MEQIYTAEEAAAILRVTESAMREYLKAGRVKGFKVGKFWRIKESALASFIAEQEACQEAPESAGGD